MIHYLKNTSTLLLGLLTCLSAAGQTLTERLILTDNEDSLYLNASSISFDRHGNYCFVIKKNDQDFFVTNSDTIGGFELIGVEGGSDGAILKTYSYPIDRPFYYLNVNGTKVYGPIAGKLEQYQTSKTQANIAITTTLNDSAYQYINGRLVSQKHKSQVDEFYITDGDWVSFSETGNVIYFLKQDSIYNLFVNGKLVAHSKFRYTQLAINNSGTYLFAEGKRPEVPIGKYDYMFFIHSMDTVLVKRRNLTKPSKVFYTSLKIIPKMSYTREHFTMWAVPILFKKSMTKPYAYSEKYFKVIFRSRKVQAAA